VNAGATASGAGSPDIQAHDDEIWSARFNRQGTQVVTTSRDRSARIWTVQTQGGRMSMGQPIVLTDASRPTAPRTLTEGHRYIAMSVHARSQAQQLLIGGVDGSIKVFSIPRGSELGQLNGCGLNSSFAVSEDGRTALTAASARDASALVWEFADDGEVPSAPRLKLSGHEAPVTAFAISRDGRRLFTGDQKGIGYLWDSAAGEKISEALNYHGGLRINAAAFLPDGRLLTASDDLSVTLYDPEQKQVEQKFPQPGFVTSLSLSADGRRFVTVAERSGGERGQTVTTLVLANVATGQSQTVMVSTADGPKSQIRSARFAPDGERIVTLHGGYDAPESLVRLWKAPPSLPPQLDRTFRIPGRLPAADAALLLANQRHELVTLHGAAAYQWSLSDLEHRQSFRSHNAVTDAGFTADGKYVATASESVKFWDPRTGKPLFHLSGPHDGPVYGVDFTPAGGRYLLATAGGDGLVKVWEWRPEAATAELVETFGPVDPATAKALRDVRFSPDGQRLAAVGDGGQARVWQLGRATPLATFADPEAATVDYLSCAFSDDGRAVAAGGADKRARIWSLPAADPESDAAGAAAGPAAPLAVLEGHADRIDSVAFLPSEDAVNGVAPPLRLLTASRDRSARAWDAATGREVISLRRHSLGLTAVDATKFTLPGAQAPSILVLTAALDGRLILWPAGP